MYVRFVVSEIHEDSQSELGVFHALRFLREEGKLFPYEKELHDQTLRWFNENLEKPARLTTSKPPFRGKKNTAISWFKDTAVEHIAKIRTLVAILENHGVSVKMLRTFKVGYVLYEDKWQIVAERFRGEQS